MIFYVGNDAWTPGDGGETGLYLHEDDPVDHPAAVIPPVNNTMFLYECTPQSWHSFIHNPTTTRTSILGWTHRPYEEGIRRHGEEGILAWKAKYL
jgi:Rps23 Pro-64 3,4-dihydroxylase Tpa1-like proline 4-hydroxylase